MQTKFPGLDNFKMEKKVADIENSITNSLLNNNESAETKNKYCSHCYYIVGLFSMCAIVATVTYVCIKFVN
jgi:hypothetical protein